MNQPIELDQQLSYSLRRQYVDEYLTRQLAGAGHGVILDLGGDKERKRGRFDLTKHATNTFVLNISSAKGTDVIGDAHQLPLANNLFNCVVCSEILEHVVDPRKVMSEVFRVLKAGGKVVITVPFLFRVHADPVDVGRYTHWFWLAELDRLGFRSTQVEKQGFFWSLATEMLREFLKYQALFGRLQNPRVRSLFARLISWARRKALTFDAKASTEESDFFGRYVGGYGIVAIKPVVE